MARTTKPFQPKSVTISGKGFEICMNGFRIQPVSHRKRGYGEQYTYRIETRRDWDDFVDRFMEKASDFADANGDDHHSYLQLVKDATTNNFL